MDQIQFEITPDHILLQQKGQIQAKENPFLSTQAEWKNVALKKENDNFKLVFEAWDMPSPYGQELIRKVYTVEKEKLKLSSSLVLQKRVWDNERKTYQYTPLKK
ncbi:MAG: hypothetical protein BroJett040_15670 [Oligoflexia bacterium]|nr:MAG: hypothetical protein BroJett040_15670 [Oligoflexia bacterium]